MGTALIDPITDPQRAYKALLDGLHRMCAHDPLIIDGNGGAAPELLPAPKAVARGSGYIAFTAQQSYTTLPGQHWRITAGDTLVLEPQASYGPGDTLLIAGMRDEFTLAGVREDGSLCWLNDLEDFEPEDYLVIGPVVELRRQTQSPQRVGGSDHLPKPARLFRT